MPRVVSVVDRFKILARDNFRCVYCGAGPQQAQLQIDHVLPKARGGLNHFDNYVTACFPCNLGKSDSVLEELLGVTEFRNTDWKCNADGIESLTYQYFIEGERINEIANYVGPWCSEWLAHISCKPFDLDQFIEAFYQMFAITATPIRFDWNRSVKWAKEKKARSQAWDIEFQKRLEIKYGKEPLFITPSDFHLMDDFD